MHIGLLISKIMVLFKSENSIKWLWYQCWINIYFTRGHVDTYLWWNRSPNCRIFFFACFTNSSRSPLWNTSKLQERLLESLLISMLQILGNSRWCPRETAYFERALKTIRMFFSLCLTTIWLMSEYLNTSRDSLTIRYMWSLKDLIF